MSSESPPLRRRIAEPVSATQATKRSTDAQLTNQRNAPERRWPGVSKWTINSRRHVISNVIRARVCNNTMCDDTATDVLDELWRSLRPGDRVRIVHVPREFASALDMYRLHDETRELYEHLVAESAILCVNEIDGWGVPWIDYTWIRNGVAEFHSLGINHDGLIRVS